MKTAMLIITVLVLSIKAGLVFRDYQVKVANLEETVQTQQDRITELEQIQTRLDLIISQINGINTNLTNLGVFK